MNYENFLNLLRKYLQEGLSNYSEIESIILFGSYANKTYTKNSDIDLCVLFKNTVKLDYEDDIFDKFLDLEKDLDKTIQCVFISLDNLEKWDRIFIENILAEGVLLYGTENYKGILLNHLELEPYFIITLNLKNLLKSDKMKLKRYIYGYKTEKKYLNKKYIYQKKGRLQKLRGFKLGRGSFIIPEKQFYIIKKEFNKYNLRFSIKRCWMQKI